MRTRSITVRLIALLAFCAIVCAAVSGSDAVSSSKPGLTMRLTKTTFSKAEAGKVKLVYRLNSKADSLTLKLYRKTGGKWAKLRAIRSSGHFTGVRKRTIKSLFGRKSISVARYRIDLKADAKTVSKRFRVKAKPATAPSNSLPSGVPSTEIPDDPLPPTPPSPDPTPDPPAPDPGPDPPAPGDTSAPSSPVKLVFIHHSTGAGWLSDTKGGLGIALRDNNYYVSDTYYDWGPSVSSDLYIGDLTDTGQWWTWFRSPNSSTYLDALYNEFERWPASPYSRMASDPAPARENEIVMFKSCFPNSNINGNPNDAANSSGTNPLRGAGATSVNMTVANVKGIYNDILEYFATRPDKLFVLIASPPLRDVDTTQARADNARAVADWLVNDWLDGYSLNNVAVFDYYNVLTSNGGSASTNDIGAASGNHHRWLNGGIEHITGTANNFLAYPTTDSHPSAAGQQKATAEFVPLLNYYYHRWANAR